MRRATRHTSQRLHGPQRLEPRHAMAGDVVLSFNSGVLTVTGDAAANAITIQDGGAAGLGATVRSRDGSTGIVFKGVRSQAVTIPLLTRLMVDMKGGDDQVFVDRQGGVADRLDRASFTLGAGDDDLKLLRVGGIGSLNVVGNAGKDDVLLQRVTVRGGTTIDTGDGADDVLLLHEVHLGGPLVTKLGAGRDVFTVQGPESALRDNGKLTLLEGTTAPPDEPQRRVISTTLVDTMILAGDGIDNVRFTGPMTIFGDVSVDLGGGEADHVAVEQGEVQARVISGEAGAFVAETRVSIPIGLSPHVAGDLVVRKSAGAATVDVIGVGGTIDKGPLLGSFIGPEPETVFVGGATSLHLENARQSTVTIASAALIGDLTVTTGGERDVVDVAVLAVGGRASITTGGAADEVRLQDVIAGGEGGDVKIDTGAGADSVDVRTLFSRLGLAIVSGIGDDRVDILSVDTDASVAIATGAGDDTIDVNSVDAIGSIGVDAGAGDDLVDLKTMAAKLEVFASLGGGDDVLDFDDVAFLGNGTFDGGAGDDRIRRAVLSPQFLGSVVGFE